MKPSKPKSPFRFLRIVDPALLGSFVLAALCCGATVWAQEEQAKGSRDEPTPDPTEPQAAPSSGPAAAPSALRNASSQPSAKCLSPVVSAVIRMADASISTKVIQTFVECSSSVDPITDADIIALNQHNVADEIVTALLTKGAKRRAWDAQRKQEAALRALAARNARSGVMDPESYEYFQYHYLQPRASASVYRRLSPYVGPRGSHGYGSYRFRHPSHGRSRY